MRRKLRIFSNIAIIALSVCMFAFGVYAASTVSVTTSGTVTFNATGVYAKVTRTVTGTKSAVSTLTQTIDSSAEDNDVFKMGENETLEFNDVSTPIVMTFTIENLAEDRNLNFKITDNGTAGTNITKTENVSTDMFDTTNGYYNVNPQGITGDTQTFTITFKVDDANLSANMQYNYSIALSEQANVTPNLTLPTGATATRIGNIHLIDVPFGASKQLNDYTVTGTQAIDLEAYIEDNKFIIPVHIYGTSATTVTANVIDNDGTIPLDYLSINSSNELTYNGPGIEKANVIIPTAMSNDEGYVGIVTYGYFSSNTNIQTIVLPKTYEETRSDGAFSGCTNLTSVTFLGNKITEFNDAMFMGCVNLSSVNVPESVTRLGRYAFQQCSSLQSLTLYNVTEIGSEAFYGCSSLKTVTLHKQLLNIGYGAFQECSNLTTMKIADDATNPITEGTGIIGKQAFKECTKLTTVNFLADGITEIGEEAFYSSSDMALNTFVFPASLKTIGANAFAGAIFLNNINLPEGLVTIKTWGLASCGYATELTTISIPSTVTNVEYKFLDCGKTVVNYNGTQTDWNNLVNGVEFSLGTGSTIKFSDGTSITI